MFDAAHWQRVLSETPVRSVDYHDELDSTNDRALSQLDWPIEELPRLVITTRQTRGRGRRGNSWWTADGALTFSLIMDVMSWKLAADRVPQLALWTGLGVRDALATYAAGRRVQLKWPNDVYLEGRKVGGILVEGTSRFPGRVVVGVGINVNNRVGASSPGSAAVAAGQVPSTDRDGSDWTLRATSLFEAMGAPTSLPDVLLDVLQQVTDAWQYFAEGTISIHDVWNPHCLLTGRHVVCQSGTVVYQGVCQGIDDDGYLLVAADGQKQRCLSGTVTHVEGLR